VERLALENAFIAGGVIAGPSLRFAAEGAFRDEGDIQSLALDIRRRDDIESRIALDYVRDFSDESLKLTLDAEEAPGGLTATLAGLPEGSASSLAIDAQGPLADWSVNFAAQAEQVIEAVGGAVIDARAPIEADARLSLIPGPELGEAARTAIGEQAELALRVAEGADGVVQVEEGRFESPSVTASASGRYIRGPGRMEFDLTLEARRALAALVEGVEFERIGFDGRLDGTPDDVRAEGAATLAGLATAPADIGEASLEIAAGLAQQTATLQAEGLARGLRLDRLGPDLLGETRLALDAAFDLEAQRLALSELALRSPLLTVEAEGEATLADPAEASLAYSVATPDLAPVAAAYDQNAAGRLSAEGSVEGPLSAPRLTGEARAENLAFNGERWGEVSVTHDITAGETVEGRVEAAASGGPAGPAAIATDLRLADRTLALTDMRAEALEAAAEGALTLHLDTMLATGEIALDAPNLAAASDLAGRSLSGALQGRVAFETPSDTQTVRLDLTADSLSTPQASLASARIEATLRDALGTPSADFTVAATELAAAGASLARLQATGQAQDLTGAPSLTAEATLETLAAPGGAAEIRRVALDLSAQDLTGAPAATLQARAEGLAAGGATVQTLTATAEGQDLLAAPRGRLDAEAAGLTLAEGVTLARATLTAQGENLASPDPSGEAELVARTLSVQDRASLDRIALAASGALSDLALRLRGAGRTWDEKPVELALDAAGDLASPEAALRVTRLRAAAGEAALESRAPFALRRDGASWRLDGLDLAFPGGGLRGDAALHPDGASGDLRLQVADLAELAKLAEAPVEAGRLDLSAEFDTRPGSPRATLDFDARELIFADIPDEAGALSATADTAWNGSVMEVEARVSGPFEEPLRLAARHPLVPSGGLLPRAPAGSGLDATLAWAGRLETFWPLLPLPDHVLRGALDLDLKLVGDLFDPRFAGAVTLRDGAYQNLETGTILTDLEADSRLREGGGLVIEITAQDGAGAPVRAEIELEGRELEARLTADNAVLVRREDVTAAASLDITAAGPLAAPDITGEVRVERAEVRLVNNTPPSLPTLDVVVKGEAPERRRPGRERGPRLDIRIHSPGDIFVRGRGLTSEWEMDLSVAGPASAPRVTGAVTRVRGWLDFLGREFRLQRGEIAFDGGREIDPRIDIALEHERPDILGRIAVRGRASDPQIAFESRPSLPESEVLPRVIFGQPRQSLTAGEAIQLATGVATLLSGGEGLLGGVRSATGLDVLSVDTSGESAAVRAGRNVAEGVFVGVRQPVDGGAAAVEVEVELRDNVTVDARTSSEEGTSLGLNWKYDF
jgi:translocation and assembly module TamB